jgi:signal transduction histidine kinase
MNLRSTTVLIVLITFLGLTLVLTLTLQAVLLRHFEEVEQQNVFLNLQRSVSAVEGEYSDLERIGRDWASRDSTIQLFQNVGTGDVQSYLPQAMLNELDVDLLLLLDPSGQVIYGQTFENGVETSQLPEGISGYLSIGSPLLPSGENVQSSSGILAAGDVPLLVVSQPVPTPDGQGPAQGVFVLGRYLNSSMLLHLGNIVQLPLSVLPYADASQAADTQAALDTFAQGEPYASYSLNEERIAGYTLLNDIRGQPAYLLRIDQARLFYQSAKRVMGMLRLALITVSVVFAIITMLFLELMVFSRLTRLSKEVNQIRISDSIASRVTVTQKDELSRLGLNINAMLSALEQAQARRWESEHRFKTLVESMHDMVFTLDLVHGESQFFGQLSETLDLPHQVPVEQWLELPEEAGSLSPHQAYIQRCMQGEHQVYEWSAQQDGRQMQLQASLSPIRDDQGNITGVVGVGRDISALKQMEEELRSRVDELMALNDSSLSLLGQLDSTHTLDNICRLAVEKFDLDVAWIGSLSTDHGQIEPAAAYGWALEELQPLKLDGATPPDPAAKAATTGQAAVEHQARPWLDGTSCWQAAFPISMPPDDCSVLSLYSFKGDSFSPSHLQTLEAFSNLVSMALQNATLFQQVRNGRKRLEILSRRLVDFQEEERRRIAMELHDEVGQILTGLNMMLGASLASIPESEQERLKNARELVNELIGRVRQMSLTLRPAMLDDLGLLPTLLWHFENYTRQTGVHVQFHHSEIEGRRFQPEIETAVYRVIQEALTNVARHAGVEQVAVQVWVAQNIINAQIEDEGQGFDADASLQTGRTFGLLGMQERATSLRGSLTVDTQPGHGTSLLMQIPLQGFLERRGHERHHSAGR